MKRFLSLFMAFVMLFTMFATTSVVAFAEGTETAVISETADLGFLQQVIDFFKELYEVIKKFFEDIVILFEKIYNFIFGTGSEPSDPSDPPETDPVEKAKLSKISVTTKPSKTTYTVGDKLSTSGMVVTATYADGKTAKVTGYTCSPEKLSTAGTQTITVSYKEGSVTKTTTFTVTVKAKTPDTSYKVRLIVTPNKTTASRGDEITYTVTMDTKEKLASMAFTTVIPNGMTYVDGSGKIDSGAKSKLGFDAIDWTEWSSRSGGKGENYVNGYSSSPKTATSVAICTFKVKVNTNASKGNYAVTLKGLDEFADVNFDIFAESNISVETTPVKVS